MKSFLLLMIVVSRLQAWNGPAHQAIAKTALDLCSPETQIWVTTTAQGQSVEALSIWPDVNRIKMRWTAKWHYINIPIGAEVQNAGDVMSYCTKTCAVDALYKQINILKTTDRDDVRRNALAWIIHIVGDIHQPLHCVNDGDRGGNDKIVRFRNRKMSLHELWDHSVTKDGGKTTPIKRAVQEMAERFAVEFPEPWRDNIFPEEWVLESYQLAKTIYRDYRAPEGTNLGPAYQDAFFQVAINREAAAAVRLSWMLTALSKGQDPFSRLGR